MLLHKPFPGNRRSSDTHRRFTRRRSSATPMVANAVLLPVGVVGVARDERCRSDCRSLGCVDLRCGSTGRSGCRWFFPRTPRREFQRYRTPAAASHGARCRACAGRDPAGCLRWKGETGRATINDTTDRRPMALAEGGNGEDSAQRIAGHGRIPSYSTRSSLIRNSFSWSALTADGASVSGHCAR